jgi:hypothetical protein
MKRKKINADSIRAHALKLPLATERRKPKGEERELPIEATVTMRECMDILESLGHKLCYYSIRKRVMDGSLKSTKTPYRLLFREIDILDFVSKANAKRAKK